MRFVLVAIAVAMCQPAFADPPVAKINGPTVASEGDIVVLDCSESQATHTTWLVDVSGVRIKNAEDASVLTAVAKLRSLGFKIEAPVDATATTTHMIFNGGKTLVLASYPGTWRIILGVSNAEGIALQQWQVKVSESGTPPVVTPDPDDPPVTPPGDILNLTAQAKLWYQSVPADARDKTNDVKETINEVGTRAKEIGGIDAIDVLLAIGLGASFGDDAAKWKTFSEQADQALAALKAKGVTVEQYGQALVSIAKGLG